MSCLYLEVHGQESIILNKTNYLLLYSLVALLIAAGAAVGDNCLCWDILNVSPNGPPESSYTFDNPRWKGGWVYFLSEGEDTLTFSVADATPQAVRLPGGGKKQEAFRYLSEGNHQITTSGSGTLNKLIVRSIPELHYSQYQSSSYIIEYGPYDWNFLSKHGVLANANTIMSSNTSAYNDRVDQWASLGRAWICHAGRPTGDATTCYNYFAANQGYQNPSMRGIISDEYASAWVTDEQFDIYTQAVQMLHDTPEFDGKWFIPYLAAPPISEGMERFVEKCVNLGYAFANERYLWEQRYESDLYPAINGGFAVVAGEWNAAVPNSVQRLIMVPGLLCAPSQSLNVNPNADFKVFMDRIMYNMANSSQCQGLYGLQWYYSRYCDEENLRYAAALSRHYCIEGNTSLMNNDPYILTHILDADFEQGTTKWTITPATGDSMETRTADTYSWIQGRYPQTNQGDTFLWTKRDASAPNVFSQQIKDLQPGRFYSLKMITGDYNDWVAGVSAEKVHELSINITGADVRQAFSSNYYSNYSKANDRFNSNNPFWMNYHWRVFKATETTADLSISDWPTSGGPGDDIGQELMFNFIECSLIGRWIKRSQFLPHHYATLRSPPRHLKLPGRPAIP